MDMLYPPSSLSHHISLQLMLQREFHVITLALLSCPHERGSRVGDRRNVGSRGRRRIDEREKQLKLGRNATTAVHLRAHVNVACQLNGAEGKM